VNRTCRSCREKNKNCTKSLVRKTERNRTFGLLRCGWKNDIKMNLKGYYVGLWTGFYWLKTLPTCGLLFETLRYMECGEVLEKILGRADLKVPGSIRGFGTRIWGRVGLNVLLTKAHTDYLSPSSASTATEQNKNT
jgi:hypothetical protein